MQSVYSAGHINVACSCALWIPNLVCPPLLGELWTFCLHYHRWPGIAVLRCSKQWCWWWLSCWTNFPVIARNFCLCGLLPWYHHCYWGSCCFWTCKVSVTSAWLQKNTLWTYCPKYDLPEVQLVVEVLRLVEELGNVWLELWVQLCELESHVWNLKVRILFLIIIIGKVGVWHL